MTGTIAVLKDEEQQQPVPSAWRATLAAIVDALRQGNYGMADLADVDPLDEDKAKWIAAQIRSYGATLVPLPAAAWDHAACMWQCAFWEVLVDLFTTEEQPSDLALHVRVSERAERFAFQLWSVHVP
jgi:hypothetical protein